MAKPAQSFETAIALAGLVPVVCAVAGWESRNDAVFLGYALLTALALQQLGVRNRIKVLR